MKETQGYQAIPYISATNIEGRIHYLTKQNNNNNKKKLSEPLLFVGVDNSYFL